MEVVLGKTRATFFLVFPRQANWRSTSMFVRLPEGGHVWAEGVDFVRLRTENRLAEMKIRLQQIEKVSLSRLILYLQDVDL